MGAYVVMTDGRYELLFEDVYCDTCNDRMVDDGFVLLSAQNSV